MKELSIEEKAQRYDEAIERAKSELNSPDKRLIEYIFPELKESEDVRIRNFISNELACLRASDEKGTVRYNELTEAIAWLEKQKHEEWSLYDEKILSEVFTSVEIDAYSEEKKKEIISWLQKYRPYMHEKRDEQKPAKWSEEDEQYFISILGDIGIADKNMNEETYQRKRKWLENKFKSFKERYTWKPSDEQITWLYRAADGASKDSRMKQILNELLSDLKKL